jgi:hypothetical protein
MAKRQAKGLGDTIENVLQATGIDKVAKFILGEDCGCNERKAKLNELFMYSKKPLCLTENEHEVLTDLLPNVQREITPLEQMTLLKIYNRVFQDNQQMTSCGSCLRDIVKSLNKVFSTYDTK